MTNPSNRPTSPTKLGAKWLLLCLAFVWLVGCMGFNKQKTANNPFPDHKFSCGEEMPNSRTSASARVEGGARAEQARRS